MRLGNNFNFGAITLRDLPQEEQNYLVGIGFKADGKKSDTAIIYRTPEGSFAVISDGFISRSATKNFSQAPGSLWIPSIALDLKYANGKHSYVFDGSENPVTKAVVGPSPISGPCARGETDDKFFSAIKRFSARTIFAFSEDRQTRLIIPGTLDLINQEKPKSITHSYLIAECGETHFLGYSLDKTLRRITAMWEWKLTERKDQLYFVMVPRCKPDDLQDFPIGAFYVSGVDLGIKVNGCEENSYKASDIGWVTNKLLVDMIQTISDVQDERGCAD